MEVSINKQAKLSEHFSLAELCKTSARTADRNIPSHVHIENLKRLCGWLEMLQERSPKGGYWLHFAVRPTGNRRVVRLVQT